MDWQNRLFMHDPAVQGCQRGNMKKNFDRYACSMLALAIAGLAPTTAFAQTAASSAEQVPQASDQTLEPAASEPRPALESGADADIDSGEIVVTAQRRTERLVQVPVAVTAISGDALASQQINDVQSLSRTIPSLTFQQGGAPNNSAFRVRGVGTSLFGQGVEPSVSVVVDGVVTPRAGSGFNALADIERVEVLRGPQGTLFGKNATAGVINITTARPANELGGAIDATVAEMDEYRVKGTVTGPISETLGARLSGYYNHIGGFLPNVKTGEDYGKNEGWGVRGKLEWEPSSDVNFLLTGDYNKSDQECCVGPYVNVANPLLRQIIAPVVATRDNFRINNEGLSQVKTTLATVSLQGDWDLGPATLTSITAWQYYKEFNFAEGDNAPSTPLLFVGATAAFAGWDYQPARQTQNFYTQEVRIGSNGNDDLTYVAGVFLSNLDLTRSLERRRQRCTAGVLLQPCAAAAIVNQSSGFAADFSSKNASVFGQIDWRVAGGLHLILGAREQYEKQRVDGRQYGPVFAGDQIWPGTVNVSGVSNRDGWGFSGRAGLRYEFDRNVQSYFTYSRGYKAFALDLGAATNFANNPGLNPEFVNAYELGFKMRTSDGTFDLNAALFRSDYSDLQLQTTLVDPATGTGTAKQVNAGKSRSQGLELEATIRPARNFSVAASFSYTDATIDVDGLSCPLGSRVNVPVVTAATTPVNSCYVLSTNIGGSTILATPLINIRGGQLPLAPKFRWSVSPQWDAPLGDSFRLYLQANGNFISSTQFDTNQDPLLRQPAYILVDASIGIGTADGKYKVTAFVRNLFDETYYTQLGHAGYLQSTTYPNDLTAQFAKDAQRYFGASLSARF
jgi:iron complex outermembrane receptor protein